MQVLSFLGVGKIFTSLVAALYSTVARCYDLLLDMANNASKFISNDTIQKITSTIYTMLAVFMLFRITITLLNYLIDPDKIEDKQVGSGKLITRIIISLVLVLSLNSIIFPLLMDLQDALLDDDSIINITNRFENKNNKLSINSEQKEYNIPFIEEVNAYAQNGRSEGCYIKNQTKQYEGCAADNETLKSYIMEDLKEFLATYNHGWNGDGLIDNGYDASCGTKGCFFISSESEQDCDQSINSICYVRIKMFDSTLSGDGGISTFLGGSYTFYYMDFNSWPEFTINIANDYGENSTTNLPVTLATNDKTVVGRFAVEIVRQAGDAPDTRTCYYNYFGTEQHEADENGFSSTTTGNTDHIVSLNFVNKEFFNDDEVYYSIHKNSFKGSDKLDSWLVSYPTNTDAIDLEMKGTNNDTDFYYYDGADNTSFDVLNKSPRCPKSIEGIICDLASNTCTVPDKAAIQEKNITNTGKTGLNNGSTSYSTTKSLAETAIVEDGNGEHYGLSHLASDSVSQQAVDFAIAIINSFTNPSDLNGKFLTDGTTTGIIANEVEDGARNMDTLLIILIGIALVVMLLVICMEAIIRNMKLMLLQVISPIAVMSYMNPNDKIFDNWVKQYAGVYFSLFIQLFVINIGLKFIELMRSSFSGLSTILLYAAAFTFIKAVPGMISKIFGIEDMGSFKDSFGMVKKGLGMGAGAVAGGAIGGIAGLATRTGLAGRTAGFLGGLGRGLISGSQGKLFKGAQNQVAANRRVQAANREGSTFGGRMQSRLNRAIGVDTPAENLQKEINQKQQEVDLLKRNQGVADATQAQVKAIEDRAEKKIAERKGTGPLAQVYYRNQAKKAALMQDNAKLVNKVEKINEAIEQANQRAGREVWKKYTTERYLKEMDDALIMTKEAAEQEYIDQSLKDKDGDTVIKQASENIKNIMNTDPSVFENMTYNGDSYADVKGIKDGSSTISSDLGREIYKRTQEISSLKTTLETLKTNDAALGGGK